MANTTSSPNMNLPVPVPGQDPGPDWANNIVADMYAIDSHNHSSGQGVPITPDGLSINSDLPLNNNNLITAKSVRFFSQGSPLIAAADVGCLYESGVDLYFNDGAGNQIRITQSGSVTGSSGTITGLPSGTASASFSEGTFTFQSATSTPANMAVGPLIIGRNVASSKTVSLTPNGSQASNYGMTFPVALPGSGVNYVTLDNTGAISFNASTGTGSVVLSANPTVAGGNFVAIGLSGGTVGTGIVPLGAVLGTFPNLSGAYSCTATTVADSNGFVKCNGQTISDGTSPMDGVVVPNINNTVFLAGSTTSGSTGGAATVSLSSANLGAHTHGAGSFATTVGVTGGTASLTGTTTFASSTHAHNMQHIHTWGTYLFSTGGVYTNYTPSNSNVNSTSDKFFNANLVVTGSGTAAPTDNFPSSDTVLYTSGVLDPPGGTSGIGANTFTPTANASIGISSTAASLTGSNSVGGTSASTGSGTSFSILPTYITALYVMRVK